MDPNLLVGLTLPEARSRVEGVGGQLWDRTEEQAMDLDLNPRRVWAITRGDRAIKAYGATPLPRTIDLPGTAAASTGGQILRRCDCPPL